MYFVRSYTELSLRRQSESPLRLIPAQFVKPYRKSNKNDFLDAAAIAEAATKQNMRFVQIKTQEQLDWQAMHRVRDRLVQRRRALINEIRGFLLDRGITFPAQPIHLRKNIAALIEDAEQNLSPAPALAAGSAMAGVEADRDQHQDDHRRDREH